jgi:LysR family glycine cleavage system transcriptional activator
MQRKLPPLKALKVFEAAARLQSFTLAADELHVTHGAVSQQIKLLEEYFHKPLFVRSHGKITLNDEGKKLLPVITNALDQLSSVCSQLLDDAAIDTLTISLTSAFATCWLIPRLNDFQQRYPNIRLRLQPSATFEGFNAGGEADVAIRWERDHDKQTEVIKLFDVDAFAACAPQLLEGKFALKTAADLCNQTLIHDDDGSAWQTWCEQAKLNDVDTKTGHYFSDSALALQAAIDGQGVITAGSILAARDLESGKLVIPFNIFMRNRNAYYLSYPRTERSQPTIKVFHRWLLEQTASYQKNKVPLSQYVVTPC